MYLHPNAEVTPGINDLPRFDGPVKVYHSAVAYYYAPSDVCGLGGIHRERIRSNPKWFKAHKCYYPRYDTVFVSVNDAPGMQGMAIGRVRLFFSIYFHRRCWDCALVHWFNRRSNEPDSETGLWVVELELDRHGNPIVEVISLDTIARGAHLLPVYGEGFLPERFDFRESLDAFDAYFVNPHVDHHAHEFLTV